MMAPLALAARHPPRTHRFDCEPAWFGPKAMTRFAGVCDPRARRRLISAARHRGSMPPEIAGQLRRELRRGRAAWIEAAPLDAASLDAGARLQLDRTPHQLEVDRVVLATGFEAHRPGGAFLDDAILDRLGLRCAECGYPLVSRRLEWAPELFVSGPLAELELGPTARNIAGARAAGRGCSPRRERPPVPALLSRLLAFLLHLPPIPHLHERSRPAGRSMEASCSDFP